MTTMAAGWTSRPSSSSPRTERGATAVEYALLITGIAAVIVLVVFAFGGGVDGLFGEACTGLQAERGQTC